MLDGADNRHFRIIKADLENNIIYGSESFPRTKDKTVEILNNYHVVK